MLFSFKTMLAEYLTMIGEEEFTENGKSLLDSRIRLTVQLMDKNTTAPPDNRELARKAGMSLKTFYEKFSRDMGMSPKRYLLNQRMERSRQMLLHSEATPEEIAEWAYFLCRPFSFFQSLPEILRDLTGFLPKKIFFPGKYLKDIPFTRFLRIHSPEKNPLYFQNPPLKKTGINLL